MNQHHIERLRLVLRIVLGVLLVVLGANHFINADLYLPMMPPWLPWHEELVYISGAFEIFGGFGVFTPQPWRKWAGYGVVALLVAVFPANVHVALNDVQISDLQTPAWVAWARLPFQYVLVLWVFFATDVAKVAPRKKKRKAGPGQLEEDSVFFREE